MTGQTGHHPGHQPLSLAPRSIFMLPHIQTAVETHTQPDLEGVKHPPSHTLTRRTQPSFLKTGYPVLSELHSGMAGLSMTSLCSYQDISEVEHYKSGTYSAIKNNNHTKLLWTHFSHAWIQGTVQWQLKSFGTPCSAKKRVTQSSFGVSRKPTK